MKSGLSRRLEITVAGINAEKRSGLSAVAPVNLIVGKEELLKDRARLAIVAAVRAQAATESDPGGRSVPVTTIRAGDMTTVDAVELFSPSLFGDGRIVVVTDCQDAGKEPAKLLMDSVKDPAPGITLILLHTGEGRQKKMVADLRKLGVRFFEAQPLKRNDLPGFVGEEFAAHGVKVRRDVIDTVLDAVGSDLRELATAISQLCADTAGKVTSEAVRTYYGASAEVSGFEIAELALRGRGGEALAKMRRALQLGMAPALLSAAITGMVGDVARLHGARGVNARRDAHRYGMPPWKLEKTQRLASAWSTPAVARAVVVAAQLDADTKGASSTPELSLEQSVLRIAELAHSSHRR